MFIFENLLHFTNGRNENNQQIFQLVMPKKRNWIKIAIIMIVFAVPHFSLLYYSSVLENLIRVIFYIII